MRTFHRLRLLFFSFNICSDVLSTLLLIALSKPGHPHQKYIATCVFATDNSVRQYTFGGGGRNRTAVQNTFLFASYNNSIKNYIRIYLVCQVVFTNVPICHSEVILFFLNKNLR
jgi:hypothetical protein